MLKIKTQNFVVVSSLEVKALPEAKFNEAKIIVKSWKNKDISLVQVSKRTFVFFPEDKAIEVFLKARLEKYLVA